ncbi:uncharacterized protein LOC111708410 [Eurytemora carolleeae]|uniref:uncharacterized protein LOC111708410 n=1 Tax=Eurytemora carolleeae TaxID=1294199 RepID=UPI000C77F6F9|nr:uncharacterized protein LOC111708410 [Eurytemora carolleeae]|eukprot:XP_023337539.1 uncharacterized protein LOC111708410 [Eurytemora affinis]
MKLILMFWRFLKNIYLSFFSFLKYYWSPLAIVLLTCFSLFQYLENGKLNNVLVAKDKERAQVLQEIHHSADRIRQDILLSGYDRSKSLLKLESAGILVGGTRNMIEKREGDVCPEHYKGNQDWPFQFTSWETQICDNKFKIDELVTIYINYIGPINTGNLVQQIHSVYPGIRIIADCSKDETVYGLDCVDEEPTIDTLAQTISTKYLLYAPDIEHFNSWANLHRSIRVLSDSELAVFGVGGSSRNRTGHWSTGCTQINLQYYRLQMLEGYEAEYEDCMVCDYTGGPVLIRVEDILTNPSNVLDPAAYLLDSALRKRGIWLVCPDILYFTRQGKREFDVNGDNLRLLASKHNFQGLVTSRSYKYETEYTCEELGLYCDAESQAAEILVPWCCIEAFRGVFHALEFIRDKYGIYYEIESGTLLGAVKLGNFIPWDIDLDIGFRTQDFSLLQPGGRAGKYLLSQGFNLNRYSEDNYSKKGAGFFNIQNKGLNTEMLGDQNNLSLNSLPPGLSSIPTLVQVGPDLWVPTISNPGLHIRGRYGPGYLYHVQSWRHAGLDSAFQSYSPVNWQPCSDSSNQACLINYPIIGNMELRPSMYP